jgi:hypothetical protein
MDIVEMSPLVASPAEKHLGVINPYLQDCYNMGTQIGHNVEVMFEHFPYDTHQYIIVVNKKSGERIMIKFKE